MTDLKFDIDGKKLSSEEINEKKDFEAFYKSFKIKNKSFYQKSWFWTSTGFASLAISYMLMFTHSKNNENLSKKNTLFASTSINTIHLEAITKKPFKHQHDKLFKLSIINLNANQSFLGYSKILPKPEKQNHFFYLKNKNEQSNYGENNSIRLSENGKLPDKNPTTFPNNSDSKIAFPDNFVPPQVPEYHKQKKRRIQIQK